MSSEVPFQVAIPQEKLELLKKKLDLTILPDELEGAGWKYGAPLADIQRLLARWKDGYDWKKHEAAINALPQFTRDIDVGGHGTLNIHYVHQKSEVADAIPLLFVHGWPGSFLEVQKILPLLTSATSKYPSFHVVAPSLPGYGYSQAPRKQGFNAAQYAEVMNKLMLSLGYNEYVTQGGDWGFKISKKMAYDYGGKSVKAWHTNVPMGEAPTASQPLQYVKYLVTPYSATERAGFDRTKWFLDRGRGYSMRQRTQPQTLGYSLADSPVGLLAWIYEKLVNWTDSYPWEDDEVLTWISVYWFSRAGPAATLRIYYEMNQGTIAPKGITEIPTIPRGFASFPKELAVIPATWTRNSGNLVFKSEHARGGHFAAYEKPEDLVDSVRRMFRVGGPAFRVVPGKSGYAPRAKL